MSASVDNQQTADAYTDACTIQDQFGAAGGSYIVSNASVYMQLQYGRRGETYWTSEFMVAPQGGPIAPRAIGVRFRNFTAGTNARVYAVLLRHPEPGLQVTGTWAGTLNANGTITF